MAGLRAAPQDGGSGLGFDPDKNRLFVPANKGSELFLVAGKDLVVTVEDEGIAVCKEHKAAHWAVKYGGLSPWERGQDIRGLKVVGKSIGSTVLHAKTKDGFDLWRR